MADEEVKKDTIDEMCWVQELIEKYLKFYMTKKEIVYVLSNGPKIGPDLVEIVWRNLEENNREFFREYRIRLALNDQIEQFNNLLEKQAALMLQSHPASASTPLTDRSWCHPTEYDNSLHQAALLAGPSENMDKAIQTTHNVYANGASSFQPAMQVSMNTSDLGGTTNGLDNNVLVEREAMQGINEGVLKSKQNTPETPLLLDLFRDSNSSFQPAMQVSMNTSDLGGTTNGLDNNVLVEREAMQGINEGALKSKQNTPETPLLLDLFRDSNASFQPAMQVSMNTSDLGGTTNGLDNNVLVEREAMQGINEGALKSKQNTPETPLLLDLFRDSDTLKDRKIDRR